MHDMTSCNEAQRCAITHGSGPMLVIAGPGSGKTFVITHRIHYLIHHHGISPEQILVITFTKAAALEMKERAVRLLGEQSHGVTFGTFHAVFFDILKKSLSYGTDALIENSDRTRFLKDILVGLNIETADLDEYLGHVLSEISRFKNSMIPAEEYESAVMESDKFRSLLKDYQAYLKSHRKIDFDDMLVDCHALLEKHPEIRRRWQEKYRYILIDEFQDVNPVQFDTVLLLAQPACNLFVVGDDDQSIYAFRGAQPELMQKFQQVCPEAEQVLLNINYRSTGSIVSGAGNLISHNKTRFAKEIQPQKTAGKEIAVLEFETRAGETEELTARLKEEPHRLTETAVLVRTNSGAGFVAEKLLEAGIPFCMRDRLQDFYSHFIGEDLMAYGRIAMGEMTRENFYKISNRPKRYLSRKAFYDTNVSFRELRQYYREKDYMQEILCRMEQDIQWIAKLRPYAAITYILKGMGYGEFLKSHAKEHHLSPEKLLDIAEEIRERSRPYPTFTEWFAGIHEYQEKLRENTESQVEGVTVATMHASKGLEFERVFVLDVNEGVTPYHKAVLPEEIEEERRMFYVAMTRAKEELFLYHVKMLHDKQTAPSRFLKEIHSAD